MEYEHRIPRIHPALEGRVHICEPESDAFGGTMNGVKEILHFVASWAESICGPHRKEVEDAAAQLGLDYMAPDVTRSYGVLNIPAVALSGDKEHPAIVGAVPASVLVERLRQHLTT
jgi:hypothetical protein